MHKGTVQDPDSEDEMPPPPPPKSHLPTTGHKLREPKRLAKAPSKDTLPKAKPQKIMVHINRYGQAPPVAASKAAPPAAPKAPPPVPAKAAPAPKPLPVVTLKPRAPKPAPRTGRPQTVKPAENPKPQPTQPRADLGTARPVSRMQIVQDANRINVHVPPVNPAKPPAKRPFQPEQDEPLHRPAKRPSQLHKAEESLNRPAKRPSQQPKTNPITPAHAQFAKGKIPFAESAQSAQQLMPPPQRPVPNGDDVKLPDILTDSEDEDSDSEFQVPSWANTPNLHELLMNQQLVDPEQIFGPIQPLNMEEVFPDKKRHEKFRERTSSAYWANDRITDSEKRKEREARERIVRNGAWTYNPSPLPPRKQ